MSNARIRRDLPNDEYQAAVGANNPSASNVFATIADLTSADIPHAVASGTNTYTVTIPGVTAYTDGDAYIIRFTNGSDDDSTLNINGLGVKTLTKKANVQITGGDIVSGQEMVLVYDGTNFQCIQSTPNQLFAYVTNDDSVAILKGQPVYAFGAAGNRMSVKLASNTSDATSAQTVGLVFSNSIAAGQKGFVITQGVIDGLNTGMYSAGNQLYLGVAAGSLTNVKPYAPNHLVYIGIVERANAGNGQIYVKPQNGYELDELHDVDLITTPPTDGQVLIYDSVTGLWKNESIYNQTVQEEGVSLPQRPTINITGAGVTASDDALNNKTVINIPGSIGATAYYLNETVTQAPYKEFSSFPTAAAEQTVATTVGVGATATVQSFQTPSGVPGTTNIPAGLWQFYLHFSGTAGNSWSVFAEVYKRDLGGIETLLLTTDAIPTTALSGTPTMILSDGVFPASTVLTTDRIVVKVRVQNTGVGSQTITFHTEGATNYSVGTTTLNQIVPTGGVTAVTGTAPITSSGGTTPAIGIPKATALVDGYLDNVDWSTFNGKQDPITLTTTGSSGASTFIANTLNIPNYTLAGLGGVPISRTLTINGTTFDLSANRTWSVGTVTSVGLTAGTGISIGGTSPITGSGTFTVTNTDPGSAVTLSSAGGTETLVNDGTGPALATKGVTAGTGISLSSTATALTVTNSAPDQTVVLTPSTGINVTGAYPNFTVVNTAPDQTVALTAGTGIGVTGTYPNFTISNTDPTTGVTLASSGGANSLVNDGTGPSLAVKGLSAGSGILIGSTATAVSITNSAPDQTVVLNAGTGIGVTGTYPNFTISNTSPSASGKIGIADSNGAFTYYSTLSAACAAALLGQTITLFTDVTETTATAAILPDGVDLNLNGNSYILDVAGATNAIETAGGGSRNNIYNGKIIRRNVGGSSFLIGVCLRNKNAELNMYGVELINEDDCTALLIEESGTVNGSWSARCDGANASGVTVASLCTPLVSNGKITSGGIGVYVETGSTINLYNSYINSSSGAIQSVGIGVELYNSTVLASANTAIELGSGTVLVNTSFIAASSGAAINVSSGTVDISLSRIASVGTNAISIGTIVGNLKIVGSHITTLNGTNNFSIENLQAFKVDISNNYFFIQGTGTRRNLTFANTLDAGNAIIEVKNNTLEVVSTGIAGSASNIYFGNYTSGFYKISGNELKCQSPSAASRCIRTSGFPLTMAYISNVLKLTNGQNPIDANITQGNSYTPDLYGNIQTD